MAAISPSIIDIAVITDVSGISECFKIVWTCFGEQTPDAILEAFNPGWDTPAGYAHAVERMINCFKAATGHDENGNLIQIFLKATMTNTTGTPHVVGFAIWIQLSMVEGHGEPPLLDARDALDQSDLYPDDTSEYDCRCTLFENLYRDRHKLTKQQASASPPAILALDMCAVHPDFQRGGIALRLVQYGLDEAKRRGGLTCCTEATAMGTSVYTRLDFVQQGSEIEYGVDGARFAKNGMPPKVFIQTRSERA